ncbi:MAG: hypothetical protein IJC65_06380 [Oscillospiraceae bacterium]|nr:hypothetical protein [Oscillospiraceae bacterium]
MLSNKEREGGIILLDLAKHICLAVAAAAVTLIVGSGKSKNKAKKKKTFLKRYGKINGIIGNAADKASLLWLKKDVEAHPEKYTKRDKGVYLEDAEIVEI